MTSSHDGNAYIGYKTKPLDASTWPQFARVVEANNGVWGGCWCMWYHRKDRGETPAEKREAKERLVREGRPTPRLCSTEEIA